MNKLKKLPRLASLPQQGSPLPFVAAGLLIVWSVFGFLVDTAVGGNVVTVLAAAALLLSQRKEQSVGMYRFALLLLVVGCVQAECRAPLAIAALLLVVSLRLWSNVSLRSGPQWVQRPVWALAAMGALVILILDHVVFVIQDFQVAWLGELLALAALLVLAMSLETRIPAKDKGPRMQAVPKEGSALLVVAVTLLMGALTFGFINTLKRLSGVDLTETIRGALGAVYAVELADVWQPLLQYIISMAACGMMLLGGNRQKNFLTAVVLLFFMSNPLRLEYLTGGMMGAVEIGRIVGMTLVLVVLLISAWGLKANKPVGSTSKVNLVALIVAICMTGSLALGAAESVKAAIENQKSIIVEAVADASGEAVYDAAYNGELTGNTLNAAFEAAYAAVKDAAYDPAFKAAQEVGVKDVNITPEDLAQYTKTIAENIAAYAADFSMQGMESRIYEDMTAMLAEVPAAEIAQQEIYKETPEARPDFRAEMKKTLQKDFYGEFEYNSGRGTINEMYLAASQAVAPILFETTFETTYNTVYDGIYELLNKVAVETANATLEEYDGTVYLRAAGSVLSALPGLVELVAMILLTLSLTVQPAPQTKTMFRRVLDWCYERVGEKMQKCMKVLGGFWLFIGALGILSIPVGLLLLPTAPVEVSLALIAGGIGSLIVVALMIILTYPLFAFAQQAADVHAIRNRAPAAVLQAAVYEEAPVQQPVVQVVSAAEETFNPDDLPEL